MSLLIRDHDIGAADNYGVPAALWDKRDILQPPHFATVRDHWRAEYPADELFVLLNFGSLPGIVSSDAAFRDLPVTAFDLAGVDATGLLRLEGDVRRLLTIAKGWNG